MIAALMGAQFPTFTYELTYQEHTKGFIMITDCPDHAGVFRAIKPVLPERYGLDVVYRRPEDDGV